MTLLHAFVRDALAERRNLLIPTRNYRASVPIGTSSESIEFEVGSKSLNVVQADTERREGSVQPDVIYTVESGQRYAIEVRYTHAVDDQKRQKLVRGYTASLEFDVSDLPASGITHLELEKYLADAHRWEWLHGMELSLAKNRAERNFRWTHLVWSVPHDFNSKLPHSTKATAKLKSVERRMSWAASRLRDIKSKNLSPAEAASWLGEQNKIDRVAIACTALRLNPLRLPDFLQLGRSGEADLRDALSHHPYSWQVIVFMKFGVGNQSFHARDVAAWCLVAMPDRCEHEDGALSKNGFTRTAACIHLYLLSLASYGLLLNHPASSPEEMRFIPKFKSVSDFQRLIEEKPSGEFTDASGKIDPVMIARFRLALLR